MPAATVIRRKKHAKCKPSLSLFDPRDDEPGRPRTRAECLPCPECQRLRDALVTLADVPDLYLPEYCEAGHDWTSVIARSRPCAHVSCRHHNLLSVRESGSLDSLAHSLDPLELDADWSCSLDVADRGAHSATEIARALGCSQTAISVIEAEACSSIASGEHGATMREANRA